MDTAYIHQIRNRHTETQLVTQADLTAFKISLLETKAEPNGK
jgi:hypothetical protein